MSAKRQKLSERPGPPRQRMLSGTIHKSERGSSVPAPPSSELPSSSDFPAPPLPPGTEATRFMLGGDELAVLSIPLALRSLPERLTPAEREVLVLVFDGRTNGEIARARGTSLRTVANQVQAIFKKLGASSRSELIARLSRY